MNFGQKKRYDVVRVVTSEEVIPFHLSNTLKSLEHDFTVAVIGDGVSKHASSYKKVDFYDIPIARKISPWADLKAVFSLFLFFKHHDVRIVHSIMPKSGLVSALSSWLARVPVRVHTFTGQVWATKQGLARTLFKMIDRMIVNLNTHCFTDSSSQSNFLFQEGVRLNQAPLPFLGHGSLSGVDYKKFNPELYLTFQKEFSQKYSISETEFVFLFIGRKCRDKGIFDLLEAFSQIDQSKYPSRLVLVGPNEDSAIAEKIKHLEKIIDIPQVNNPEQYFSIADAFCIFSHREGFGTVAIEASAAKLPVLGTKIPGLIDSIVDGKTGRLVQLGDITEIRNLLIEALSHPDVLKTLGQNGYEMVVEKYSSEKIYSILKSFYLLEMGKIKNV